MADAGSVQEALESRRRRKRTSPNSSLVGKMLAVAAAGGETTSTVQLPRKMYCAIVENLKKK